MRSRFTPAVPVVLLSIAFLIPESTAAQETADATLATGRRSIQLGSLNGEGASFGFWRMRSETTNLGILVGANTGFGHTSNEDLDESSNSFGISVSVGPELRRYTATDGRVAPYTSWAAT